jgi:hypothetical protein
MKRKKYVQGFDYAVQTIKNAHILGRRNVGDQ